MVGVIQPRDHEIATRTLAVDLTANVGNRVSLFGWLLHRRTLGGVTFLILRDRSGTAQAVLDDPGLLKVLAGLQVESVLQVTGVSVQDDRARGGAELHVDTINVLTPVTEPLPFEINRPTLKSGLDFWLDRAPLALRHANKQAVSRVMASVASEFRAAMDRRGFIEIFTPKIVGSATEGGANVFPVSYFDQPAFLAQSPQLYKQIMVGVHERVYEVGPVFRAEPHATSRHLNEYISLDLEFGFIQDHRDVMTLIEGVLREMFEALGSRNAEDLKLLNAVIPAIDTLPIVTFREAQEIILREYGEDCRHEPDLAPQHERWLGEWALRQHGSDFLFVEGYPTAKRPFYTMPSDADHAVSNSFDLLFRGLELITGGQREHRLDHLTAIMTERGIDPTPFGGYLDAFRFGMPAEGGCAIGLERFVTQLVGASNIREVKPFPRDINRLTP